MGRNVTSQTSYVASLQAAEDVQIGDVLSVDDYGKVHWVDDVRKTSGLSRPGLVTTKFAAIFDKAKISGVGLVGPDSTSALDMDILSNGNYVIVGSYGNNVRCIIIDTIGNVLVSEFLALAGNNSDNCTRVKSIPSGGFAIFSTGDSTNNAYLRSFNNDGSPKHNIIYIGNYGVPAYQADICVLSNGNLALTWFCDSTNQVRYAIYNQSGGVVKAAAQADSGSDDLATSAISGRLRILPTSSGFTIVWSAINNSTKCNAFDLSGTQVGVTKTLVTSGTGTRLHACVLSNGNIAVAVFNTSTYGLRIAIVDPSNNVIASSVTVNAVATCGTNIASTFKILPLSNGYSVVVVNTASAIEAYKIDPTGSVSPKLTIETSGINTFCSLHAYTVDDILYFVYTTTTVGNIVFASVDTTSMTLKIKNAKTFPITAVSAHGRIIISPISQTGGSFDVLTTVMSSANANGIVLNIEYLNELTLSPIGISMSNTLKDDYVAVQTEGYARTRVLFSEPYSISASNAQSIHIITNIANIGGVAKSSLKPIN